jgi:hypothetical protein
MMKDFFNDLNKNSNERIAIGILGTIIVLLIAIPALQARHHHHMHDDIMVGPPSVTAPPLLVTPANPGTQINPDGPALSMEEEASVSLEVAGDIIGLPEADAAAWAEKNGRTVRVGSRDGEFYALTMDYRPSRLTLDIVDGTVTNATVG